MRCLKTLFGEGSLFSISWAPGVRDELVSASSNGEVVVWDTVTGEKKLAVVCHGGAAVHHVAWNPLNYEHIVSSGQDCHAVVIASTGQVLESPVFVHFCIVSTKATISVCSDLVCIVHVQF